MNNDNILSENHKKRINEILSEIPGLEPKIIFVDNPYLWAKDNGIPNIKQDDIAFSIISQKLIVIKRNISQEDKKHVFDGIDLRVSFVNNKGGFSQAERALNTDEKFVEHTVRHERSHILFKITQKDEAMADVHAFEEMGDKVIIRVLDTL